MEYSIEVNYQAALATALHCKLSMLRNDALTTGVTDFRVAVKYGTDELADESFVVSICGYIKTNRCGKETILEFTVFEENDDSCNEYIVTTQYIDINLPEQDDDYVPSTCFVPRPNEPVWVDFDERKVFYKWKDSLGMTLDDFYNKIDENKLTLNTIADDIIDTILAKVEPSEE